MVYDMTGKNVDVLNLIINGLPSKLSSTTATSQLSSF